MNESTKTNDLLTVEEAAGVLGVTVQTLAVWRSTKRWGLPYVKVGRLVRYSRKAIDRWIEARTVVAFVETGGV